MSLCDPTYNLHSVIFPVLKGHGPEHSSKEVLDTAGYETVQLICFLYVVLPFLPVLPQFV